MRALLRGKGGFGELELVTGTEKGESKVRLCAVVRRGACKVVPLFFQEYERDGGDEEENRLRPKQAFQHASPSVCALFFVDMKKKSFYYVSDPRPGLVMLSPGTESLAISIFSS